MRGSAASVAAACCSDRSGCSGSVSLIAPALGPADRAARAPLRSSLGRKCAGSPLRSWHLTSQRCRERDVLGRDGRHVFEIRERASDAPHPRGSSSGELVLLDHESPRVRHVRGQRHVAGERARGDMRVPPPRSAAQPGPLPLDRGQHARGDERRTVRRGRRPAAVPATRRRRSKRSSRGADSRRRYRARCQSLQRHSAASSPHGHGFVHAIRRNSAGSSRLDA